MGQMTRWPSVWCSKYFYFFHKILQNSLQKSLSTYKNENKSFECPNSIRNYEKKNTWNESFVPSAYYIVNCRIFDLWHKDQNSPSDNSFSNIFFLYFNFKQKHFYKQSWSYMVSIQKIAFWKKPCIKIL